MPKSKQRQKPQRRAYVPPAKVKKKKPSPRWYPFLMLGLIFAGVAIIVLNYMGLVPGSGGVAGPQYLWIGLGLIAAGFIASTGYR